MNDYQYEKQLLSKERNTKYNGATENLSMAPNGTAPYTPYSRLSIIPNLKIPN